MRRVLVWQIVCVAALVLAWDLAARFLIDRTFLSPPIPALQAAWGLLGQEVIRHALFVLIWELALAFVLSVIIGLAVGLLLGMSRISHQALMPVVLLLYATPQIAILPVIMLAAGIGPASKVIFGVTHGFFPVAITVAAATRNLKPALLVAARSMGASRWLQFRHVILPHIVPGFFTGMRLAMTAVLLGVLLAELYASSNGIGQFTRQYTDSFKPAQLLGLIILVAGIAVVLNVGLRAVQRRASRWQVVGR